MRSVRQKYKNNAKRARVWGGVAVLAVAALASGCADDDTNGARVAGGPEALHAPPARALDSYAARLREQQAARVVAAKRWGLAKVPLAAPPAPARKPVIRPRDGFEVTDQDELGLPPVFTTVPTKDKVVFLTIDDGSEKDPAFLRMMSDLKIPYTAFLSNYLIKDDYGYFRKMRDQGVTLNNHTLTHPYLPGLSYEEQRHEICGMQDIMEKQFGKRPKVLRPPYGNYNQDTLRAAKSCGIKYAPIWDEEVFVDHWEYRDWDRDLHPGDIVLTHFRGKEDWDGTMPDMVRRFLKKVTDKGYAVARLEDYL
ncbi:MULTISPECIES: polysaccharide deacetylase family protein [unclassified Streptomyces]|jgi:peptidoglycan/xylan/chitin deacetylase (PgdA/CDA1 family)|uniref:polysaccharide deacetylase family protein n=1 Tax=unclassified Streptomyces TaxID=2593676 RepID=UPI002253032A|nr:MULTISPECIES: polysaccharide deacetylase family protein [unclassified Streptomyces]MCX4410785.1 polysaccharide deacetylase family protein [Streptomyces sp. NBC_01764]MCX5092269.1 polysaccharide deacetylase family protein [Streptomyces sp. NBC_00365]MCX5186655.1 polysaccharide deacetylase family protein [Streptomyces sp. NBC_00268]